MDNFADQWLYLRNLKNINPDFETFPDFDDNLRQAMKHETELFFGNIIREDRSLVDLLNANYTFINERLARHYGIPNVYGTDFRRVTLADDRRRGLLGQASILTITSYATRTSPVQRGKWILTNLIGMPPDPPPPNVPALKEHSDPGKVTSLRERMEEHRKNPACAGCHKLMDPIGFSLENFDAVGQWRTTDEGAKIDPAGRHVQRRESGWPGGPAPDPDGEARDFRRRIHREADDLRAGPRHPVLRHARCARHRSRCWPQ